MKIKHLFHVYVRFAPYTLIRHVDAWVYCVVLSDLWNATLKSMGCVTREHSGHRSVKHRSPGAAVNIPFCDSLIELVNERKRKEKKINNRGNK